MYLLSSSVPAEKPEGLPAGTSAGFAAFMESVFTLRKHVPPTVGTFLALVDAETATMDTPTHKMTNTQMMTSTMTPIIFLVFFFFSIPVLLLF